MSDALQRSHAYSRLSVFGALLLAVYACPAALRAQQIYQSVDGQGHLMFSDRPGVSGAERREDADESLSAPQVLHFCWTNCFTLEAEHGVYSRVDGTDETWTVERFSRQSFVLHRHDAPAAWNRFKPDVTYAGEVSNDRLLNVTVDGWPVDGIEVAWGGALDTLPGSNAERDQPGEGVPPSQAGGPTPDEHAPPEVTATEEPPPLPDEGQPPCEAAGSVWTPGYWAWHATAYYWVRGVWVRPPRVGALWTPGYWALAGGVFVFHRGYWGPRVGYYGGLNYGHGYFGSGYSGGRWVAARFIYNTAVTNVNSNIIRDTYREPAANLPTRVADQRVPSHVTSFFIPRDHTASPRPYLAPKRTQRMRRPAPSVATTRAVAAEHTARHPTPAHSAVAASRTHSRGTPSRGSSPPRPTTRAAE